MSACWIAPWIYNQRLWAWWFACVSVCECAAGICSTKGTNIDMWIVNVSAMRWLYTSWNNRPNATELHIQFEYDTNKTERFSVANRSPFDKSSICQTKMKNTSTICTAVIMWRRYKRKSSQKIFRFAVAFVDCNCASVISHTSRMCAKSRDLVGSIGRSHANFPLQASRYVAQFVSHWVFVAVAPSVFYLSRLDINVDATEIKNRLAMFCVHRSELLKIQAIILLSPRARNFVILISNFVILTSNFVIPSTRWCNVAHIDRNTIRIDNYIRWTINEVAADAWHKQNHKCFYAVSGRYIRWFCIIISYENPKKNPWHETLLDSLVDAVCSAVVFLLLFLQFSEKVLLHLVVKFPNIFCCTSFNFKIGLL